MALPRIEHPIFQTKLYSDGTEIKFRPFTVKEEKILLMAEMGGTSEEIVLAVKQILTNCIVTEGVDVEKLAIFDLESLFIKLRAKSVGNIIPFVVQDAEDEKQYDVDVDLDEVVVSSPEGHSRIIQIGPGTYMQMKYPTVNDLDLLIKFNKGDVNSTTKLLAKFIDSVYDEEKVYDLTEETEDSLSEWLDTFDREYMEAVNKFWTTMPTLTHVVKYKNSLNHDRSITMRGLTSFFH